MSELADQVCRIILHNHYASFCSEEEYDLRVRFVNNILGVALMAWWLDQHPGGQALLVCSYCKTDECSGCQPTFKELFKGTRREKD